MLLISFWLVLVFLGAFLSLKQAKNEGEFCATLGNRFPSQSRDARKKIRERNLTWSNFTWLCEIQKESKFRTNLEYFIESILYILSIVLKLGKSKVQRFKRCANWSWNEEAMVIWRQLQQAENEFRNPFSALRNFHKPIYPLRNWRIPQPLFSIAKSSCVIFRYFRTNSVRFFSQDILCNYLFSPCNQLKVFLGYLGYLKEG